MRNRAQQHDKLKLFISYSRKDSEAADELVDALEGHGFQVTIDRRDLPFGEKWQAELAGFIRDSDTVIWLVSDHSVASEWCNWELDEVAKRNKRLVPVMIGPTASDQIPRQLGEIHILPPTDLFDVSRDFSTLVETLETDRVWLKEHTRLADRAAEWRLKRNNAALLLRGTSLSAAEIWKDRQPSKAPEPSGEVLDLILTSRRAANVRQRMWVGGALLIAVSALALSVLAYFQRQQAITNAQQAQQQEKEANRQRVLAERNATRARQQRDQALLTESTFLTRFGSDFLRSDQPGKALELALRALPKDSRSDSARPLHKPALSLLKNSLLQISSLSSTSTDYLNVAPHAAKYFSRTDHLMGHTVDQKSARLIAGDGTTVRIYAAKKTWVAAFDFHPPTGRALIADDDGVARIYGTDGQLLFELPGHAEFDGEPLFFRSASFIDDEGRIATVDGQGAVRLWSKDGALIYQFKKGGGRTKIRYNNKTGRSFILTSPQSFSQPYIITVLNDRGTIVSEFKTGITDFVSQFEVSNNGRHAALIGTRANKIELWSSEGQFINIFSEMAKSLRTSDAFEVRNLSFAHSSRKLMLFYRTPGLATVKLGVFDLERSVLREGPNASWPDQLSANGRSTSIAALVNKRRIKIWDTDLNSVGSIELEGELDAIGMFWGLDDEQLCVLMSLEDSKSVENPTPGVRRRCWSTEGSIENVTGVIRSPKSAKSAIAARRQHKVMILSVDGESIIWDYETNKTIAVPLDSNSTSSLVALPNERFATGLIEGSLIIWDWNGKLLKLIAGAHSKRIVSISTCRDIPEFITVDVDGQIRHWDSSGNSVGSFPVTAKAGSYGNVDFRQFRLELSADCQRALLAFQHRETNINRLIMLVRNNNNWNVQSVKIVSTDYFEPRNVVLSSDGSFFLTTDGHRDHQVKVWSFSGSLKHVLKGLDGNLGGQDPQVLFTQLISGDRLAMASAAGNRFRVWDLSNGKVIEVGPAEVYGFAESSNARWRAFGEGSKIVIQRRHRGKWIVDREASNRRLGGTIMGFSPTDRYLLVDGGRVAAIDLAGDYDALLNRAERVVTRLRPLTRDERCKFGLESDCNS
ncbi:MAG: TIR domain-containing protein [Pseudomonadota bacterium]